MVVLPSSTSESVGFGFGSGPRLGSESSDPEDGLGAGPAAAKGLFEDHLMIPLFRRYLPT